jgi:hypothetical protein
MTIPYIVSATILVPFLASFMALAMLAFGFGSLLTKWGKK